MSTKLIVIVGITGTQGGSVADVFLSEPGWRIRGITRDPTKSAAQSLSAKGIEMVQADLDEPSTLQNAFQGANAIYAVTDFWQPFFNPSTKAKLKPGQIMNEFCHAAKMSVVQIGLYATHWQAAPLLAPQKQPDGTYVLLLTTNPDTPMPMIDTKKDTGQFVRALVQLPPGKNLLAYGSMISWKDYMALWARILKLPGGFYKQLTIEDVDKMAPGGFGREVAEGWVAQGKLGYDGGDPTVLHPKDLGINIPTTSIDDYIKNEDSSPVLG